MCEPASLTAAQLSALQLAVAAASAAMTYKSADNTAKTQERSNEAAYRGLLQEADQTRMDSERQRGQEFEAAADETNKYAAAARADLASFDALIGEGAAGSTADRRVATIGIQNGENLATLSNNSNRVQSELGMGERSSLNATGQKIASLRPVDRPSALGAGLTIAGAGLRYSRQQGQIKRTGDFTA